MLLHAAESAIGMGAERLLPAGQGFLFEKTVFTPSAVRVLIFPVLEGTWRWALGAAVPLIPYYILFQHRMMGGGDGKLLSAVGGMAGPEGSIRILITSTACGAAIALALMLTVTGVADRFRRFASYVLETARSGEVLHYREFTRSAEGAEFHFAVPVLMAVLLYAAGIP